jgi:hypothetical protein
MLPVRPYREQLDLGRNVRQADDRGASRTETKVQLLVPQAFA